MKNKNASPLKVRILRNFLLLYHNKINLIKFLTRVQETFKLHKHTKSTNFYQTHNLNIKTDTNSINSEVKMKMISTNLNNFLIKIK